MKHWRQRLFVILGVIVCFGIFIYFTRGFWHDQLRAYYLGKIEVTAEHYQNLPEDIDTVEIFTLGYNPDSDDANGFVGDYNEKIGTLAHKTINGKDVKEIVSLWGAFPVGRELQHMCFNPAYGLQFKQRGKIYFQTSVCWECSGYTLPVAFFGTVHMAQNGFDSKSKGAQRLLEILENYLPLPPQPKKVQDQKSVAGITNS